MEARAKVVYVLYTSCGKFFKNIYSWICLWFKKISIKKHLRYLSQPLNNEVNLNQ